MKLSFTTAGCPGWTFNEIFATAKDLGMQGIEIRGLGDAIFAPDIEVFSDAMLPATLKKLRDGKMEIPVLDSVAALAVDGAEQSAADEGRAYIELASRLGTPYIRVMCTPRAEPIPANLELCAAQYRLLCDFGAARGVTPLMETNGVLADSAELKRFMDRIDSPNKGVLWDIHHPYRYFSESPSQTAHNLGGLIKHTHIKDSVVKDGVVTYKMMGYGDVPIADAVAALRGLGYEGYVSLEWLKRYNPTLQEPGIVFAHFASYMGFIFEQGAKA